MKKSLSLLLALLMLLTILVSCDNTITPQESESSSSTVTEAPSQSETEKATESESVKVTDTDEESAAATETNTESASATATETQTVPSTESSATESQSEKPIVSETEKKTEKITEKTTEKQTESESATETVSETESESESESESETEAAEETYKYTNFTASEKELIRTHLGTLIPFIPTNSYNVETINMPDGISKGIMFSTLGNTTEEFEEYLERFSSCTLMYKEDGKTYQYKRGDLWIEIYFYKQGARYRLDVQAYLEITAPPAPAHTYTDFTSDEKSFIKDSIGFLIPFIPNDEYYVEEYEDTECEGLTFYTFGNTAEEFEAYFDLFSGYTYEGSVDDEYGDTWYFYSKGDVYIDLSYYFYEGEYVVHVYAYTYKTGGETESETKPTTPSTHTYTDFTSDEKSLIRDSIGFLIPFIPNDEYYVEEYEDDKYTGLVFYTLGNTPEEYKEYLDLFSSYTFAGTNTDTEGDTWYLYSNGSIYIDVIHYVYEGEYVVQLYAYTELGGSTGGGEDETDPDPEEPEINYGTLANPVTTTYAYTVSASLGKDEFSAQPFYVKGTITAIGEDTGDYYKNVYFTDGNTNLLIYTLNLGSGISGIKVGDTIVAYGYIKNYNGTTIEMASKGSIYVNVVKVEGEGGSTGGDITGEHTYTDFNDEEKTFIEEKIGFIIPFIPNDEYYVKEYSDTEYSGISYYTFGNTAEEFEAYLNLFSRYTSDGTDVDEYGDTWYYFSNGDVCIDVSFYYYEGAYVVDLYAYTEIAGGGSTGGDETDADVITNAGAGLPEGTDGIFNIDFTKAENVKDVTDQGYYIDGCPTMGSPAVLVIPVEFSDITAQSKGYTIENLEKIFNGNTSDTTYYSVHDYFFISSYNKLDLDITVVDAWFRPEKNSNYYAEATYDYYGDGSEYIAIGDQLILDEALAYLSTIMDLGEFDSDDNGIIDAVVMVNTLEINSDVGFQWAYRYWNIFTDAEGNYYEYDEVSANDYIWMAYDFMFELHDEETGETSYANTNPLTPYTFIHEFSHILGAEDYYDTSYSTESSGPMNGLDIMDALLGDHNPYTKFNYGWLTTSKLIVTDSTLTVTLDAYAKAGDTVIIANNWDEKLGAYQEYYIIMYYTREGLNREGNGYFLRDGIVVYHVNASLFAEEYDGEIYYDVYNNNTDPSDEYGTQDNLIELIKCVADTYTYAEGDTLPEITDDQGNQLGYTFTVDSLTSESATITFTKIN